MSSFIDDLFQPIWRTIIILTVATSSISLTASSTMALFVARPKSGGLKTPYRRIIFGISISDIFLSIALVSGPFAIPTFIENSFGLGNEVTCAMNGVSLTLGSTAMQYYVCLLSFYFLCKLKHRMTDEAFTRKYERKAHIFIALFCVVSSTFGVFLGVYNTTGFRNCCFFATKPYGCRIGRALQNDDYFGEQQCDAPLTTYVDIMNVIVVFFTFAFNAIGITVIMIMLIHYANKTTKNMINSKQQEEKQENQMPISKDDGEADASPPLKITNGNDGDETLPNNHDHLSSRKQLQSIAATFRKEIVIQAALWVGIYAITNTPVFFALIVIMFNVQSVLTNSIILSVAPILFSTGGIFNIFVYTRPKVYMLRMKRPELSRIRALWIIFKEGGVLPQQINDKDYEHHEEIVISSSENNVSAQYSKQVIKAPIRHVSSNPYHHDDDIIVMHRRAGNYNEEESSNSRQEKVNISSLSAHNGTNLSFKNIEDIKYCSQENWSYVDDGDGSNTIVHFCMFDHLSEANLDDFGLSFTGSSRMSNGIESVHNKFAVNATDRNRAISE